MPLHPVRALLALAALALLALAATPSASATCVTYKGTGACATVGGSGTGPGVVPAGGDLCIDDYCPNVGQVPYTCLATIEGQGAFDAQLCVGYPTIPPI